jgi:hypothetical protein
MTQFALSIGAIQHRIVEGLAVLERRRVLPLPALLCKHFIECPWGENLHTHFAPREVRRGSPDIR